MTLSMMLIMVHIIGGFIYTVNMVYILLIMVNIYTVNIWKVHDDIIYDVNNGSYHWGVIYTVNIWLLYTVNNG